ncbi:NAD(P)-dependent alcohol dehydrogenase [Pseudonocardia sp. TRM90224]|uniref:NAD(P)-dependent alcohol dehydrogenase n=1 Tax=Pseudonocardia sp. TRM90224 TaxID=2812678 RepID=UPI001E43A7D6|nr:NAD(P)-dependent alcohol dehydrogenase [Pseudonocardia sp. TRM90224]
MSAERSGERAASPLLPATMRAVVQEAYGSYKVLEIRDVPVPEPAEGEVLIKVHASSLNAADWHVMAGEPVLARLALGLRRPKEQVQGRDVAGRVVRVGASVTAFRPGDEVFGRPGPQVLSGGGFAEYARARVDRLVAKPAGITFEQAAAVPLAGNTALQGLRHYGEVRAGQKVLVNGASGGVGTFAVQIAKVLGAEVTGVCSTRNVDLVRSIGADHVIDYTRQDVTDLGVRYDVVLDLVPFRSVSRVRRILEPGGTFVLGGGGGGRLLGPFPVMLRSKIVAPFVSQRFTGLDEVPDAASLGRLAEWVRDGKVKPVVERVHPLSEVPEAMRYLVEEHASGKIVITAK